MGLANEYVEIRNGGYYVASTRIGLDVIAQEFQDGRTAEAIFESYPALESLAKVYGAIAFILDHQPEIQTYLDEQDSLYEEVKVQHALPSSLLNSFEKVTRERSLKQA